MADKQAWNSTEVVAWTEHEGPGRPPAGPRRALSLGLAATLGAVFIGMMSTDTLCPEHRAWVQALGSAALVGVVLAGIGLLRQWAVAPALTVASALAGVAIGFIDAAHAPTRGHIIAVVFAAVAIGATWLALRQVPLVRWDRAVRRELRPEPAVLSEVDPAPAPAATVVDDERSEAPTPLA